MQEKKKENKKGKKRKTESKERTVLKSICISIFHFTKQVEQSINVVAEAAKIRPNGDCT